MNPPEYDPFMYLLAAAAFATVIAGWGCFQEDMDERKKARRLWLWIFGVVFIGCFFFEGTY